MARLILILSIVAGSIALGIAIGALVAFPVMWLWNYLFTDGSILGVSLPALDFWHAWALLVLTGLLVKSGSVGATGKK
jgi:hypothetical protein